ncbi:SAM-dependent methyltransferase [Cellulomonas humilata]|uniref:SAM-dependent methyltransferase n=1 Tax=Cellulomonas humilata TaxID=144055 RepID=A0ABU0EJV9_9CELL|nr:class I SAM-dependent methyltransferase [Cellulomonas humilata]MDQ0375474.1 SAM-dependent methyltransferase [Cellulomonas humilata]
MDLPRHHTIRESSHRILDPFTDAQLATLGRALHLTPGTTLLDLACGKGELLCTWARDHGTVGTGVDLSTVFVAAARERAASLGVEVTFVQGDASGYVAESAVDIASCVGATWIGGGVVGTLDLLGRSLRPGGIALVGEPFWRTDPPEAALAIGDFVTLPALVEQTRDAGWDLVEMVLADEASWDRYVAAQWLNVRRFLDENPDDELAPALRHELSTAPLEYVTHQRPYLGWGVFALVRRP